MDSTEALLNTPLHVGTRPHATAGNVAQASTASSLRRWSATTTCSRCTTFTPTYRIAIWAAFPRCGSSVLDELRAKGCRAAASSKCAAKPPPCATRFAAWLTASVFAIVLVYFVMVVNFQSWIGSVHHPDGHPGHAQRNPADAFFLAHYRQRAGADGRYHEYWGRYGQQHFAGDFRERFAPRRRRWFVGGLPSRDERVCGRW